MIRTIISVHGAGRRSLVAEGVTRLMVRPSLPVPMVTARGLGDDVIERITALLQLRESRTAASKRTGIAPAWYVLAYVALVFAW